MSRLSSPVNIGLAALLLTGCTVGPQYSRPAQLPSIGPWEAAGNPVEAAFLSKEK
ncbi:hypothetical protein C4K37_3757 [Pseudomonas chlororaphis subsp. piscium]|uniref:RND transporter n=1 Tax=Pseudomonas chlororaphis TaxID=587753 RepID=A0AAX3FQ53_9PSED|nr:hypothetical protein C4K37_3757 [Pseudomonas chlororaphis subsp. piscium]AZC44688.1 hypothetical protein C4K36_3765 [Pseudomonas chlororaphis subsp. piscium]AZC76629.1 hypothetical protein C4K31_3728 [Pseudomonas chlororaphis subsp. piscium]VEF72643.1 Uncharacterised protein [Pseudomonas chlororaphis]